MPTPDYILELRKKIGNDELWLSGVAAVVTRDVDGDGTEVLLAKRADNGEWTSVTGIIDPGEEPAVAAEREVLEEANVVAEVERLVWVHVLPAFAWENGDRAQFLELVFHCRYMSGDAHPADGENTEVGWFRLDALPELSESHRERIRVALAGDVATRFER